MIDLAKLSAQKADDKPKEESKPVENKPEAQPIEDKQKQPVEQVQVVESQAEPTKANKLYTSAPVMNLKVGKFQFTKGVLTLTDPDDIAMFEKLLRGLPPRERNAIRTISIEKAEQMVRPIEPGMTKAFDSAVGRQRETIAGTATVGTVALEDPIRTESLDDMNIPVNSGQGTGDSTTAQS